MTSRRVVLVTGCSSGIGKATALRLSRGPFSVWATARRPEALAELEAAGCTVRRLDLTDRASMRAVVEEITAAHGAVAALVNNAGYSQPGAVEAVDVADVRTLFETNVFGLLELTQLVLPGMRAQRWGRIVNVSSMAGRMTLPGAGCYHASKYALEAMSDALRYEVAGMGIGVVLVEPGLIRSRFSERAVAQLRARPEVEAVYRRFHEVVAKLTHEAYEQGPLSKLTGQPDDVAAVIEEALTVRRPRARYPVPGSTGLLLAARSLVPDRAWDLMLRATYPRPRETA